MEQIKALLTVDCDKHLIIGASLVQFEAFVKKSLEGYLNDICITTVTHEHIIIKTVKHTSASQCLFINTSSIASFMKMHHCLGFDSLTLSSISLTFLEPQADYEHIQLFSSKVYGIKGWDYNCPKQLKEIDLSSLTPNHYISSLLPQSKRKIFLIQKVRTRKMKRKAMQCGEAAKKQKKLGANSLISISNEIRQFIQKHLRVTSAQLIHHVIAVVKEAKMAYPKRKEVSLLNIHRRVYDSINIMCAIGLIRKECNHIVWVDPECNKTLSELRRMNQMKKEQLMVKTTELNIYTKFYQSNSMEGRVVDDQSKTHFPLTIIPFKAEETEFLHRNSMALLTEELLQKKLPKLNEFNTPSLFPIEDRSRSFVPKCASNELSTDSSKINPLFFDFGMNIDNNSDPDFIFGESISYNSKESIFDYNY